MFLTGGTGALGARLLPLLRARGHTVTGLTRSAEGRAQLARCGATPLTGDVFDRAALEEGCRSADAVVDCSTVEPRLPRPGGRDWSVNDRIRRHGTRNLVTAAAAAGMVRYVHCGLGLVYGDHGDAWVNEETDLRTPLPLGPAREGEAAVLRARAETGLPALVLRMGTLYGVGFSGTERLLWLVRRRLLPLSGNAGSYTSFLHLDDAAAAVAQALATDQAPPVLNVCDDAPAPVGAWLPWLAQELGAGTPRHWPRWLASLFVDDRDAAVYLHTSLRMTNALARHTLGFRPRFPSYRDGFRADVNSQPA
ncbi:MAG: NAD(P)-dependent oxidoreductase [Chloroflexi bacterium]|nr:NAD(P)-dependent oxidoreductase [Chloroflexota bacterium]